MERPSNFSFNIIRSPEEIPEGIRYRDLGEIVGYKAASILWIQKHAPHIPTARMIVAPPGISTEEIIRTATEQNVQFPWIIRSSTPEDNIPEYEGALPTLTCPSRDNCERTIMEVKYSPSTSPLPFRSPEATVMIAEKSPSTLVGTMAAHPNNRALIMASVSNYKRENDPKHATFFITPNGIQFGRYWSSWIDEKDFDFISNLEKICRYYYDITQLPDIDETMTHQMEFGLKPDLFFQLRDFIPRQMADFRLKTSDTPYKFGEKPLVIGITPPEGITAQILNHFTSYNDLKSLRSGDPYKNLPIALVYRSYDRSNWKTPRSINLILEPLGLLAHEDVRIMRTHLLTILAPSPVLTLKTGTVIRIISDGIHATIEIVA